MDTQRTNDSGPIDDDQSSFHADHRWIIMRSLAQTVSIFCDGTLFRLYCSSRNALLPTVCANILYVRSAAWAIFSADIDETLRKYGNGGSRIALQTSCALTDLDISSEYYHLPPSPPPDPPPYRSVLSLFVLGTPVALTLTSQTGR